MKLRWKYFLVLVAASLIILRSSMPGEAAGIINDVNRYLSLDTAQTGNFMTFFYCELTECETDKTRPKEIGFTF